MTQTPFGLLRIEQGQSLVLSWDTKHECHGHQDQNLHQPLVEAIQEWCEGKFVDISLWVPTGQDFTSRVLQTCALIPWGEIRTYGQLADAVGSPRAARAVGQAMRRNPLPLLIPCHRVVSASGIGGYSGKDQDGPQLVRKRAILAFEQDVTQSSASSI